MMTPLFNHHTKRAIHAYRKMKKQGKLSTSWHDRYWQHVYYAEAAERVGHRINQIVQEGG